MLAFAWTSWYGLFVTIAAGIVTIGGAVVITSGGAKWLAQTVRPSEPLVSFGHPSEDFPIWHGMKFMPVGTPANPAMGKSWEQWWAQEVERARLARLNVSYLIENKDSTPLRNLTTGIRKREGGEEHSFGAHFVQILSAGETTSVTGATVPPELHEGMTDTNRALNFLYWARFERSGRRWEGVYDPQSRELTYRRLRRRK